MKTRAFPVLLAFASLLISPARGAERALPEDPYLLVTQETMPNGIHVVFAPSDKAKTFRMKIRVRAGFASETEESSGISHLLEHYLFTDAKLKDDMSYVEVIKEKGGNANGQTSEMETTYFATVPSTEAHWLTELFYGMLFHRNFEAERLEQVKKPVLLEIGKPEPLAWLLDSVIMKVISPKFLRAPDFWESEFGIHHERFSHAHESLNTIRLSAKELESYYRAYYHPGNVTLFFSGKFDPVALHKQISESFNTVQDWPGKSLIEDVPTPRNVAFVRSTATTGTPYITLGTKVQDMTPEDESTIRVYLEYLAHRLTKEIRNKHGDTYGVRPIVALKENFGDAYVMMESPSERYRQYLDFTKSMIQNEARNGQFTEAQFKEAIDLYSTHYKLTDRDSETQMQLAESYDRWSTVYRRKISSFDAFRSLNYADFRERLQKLFQKNREVSILHEPPLVGRMESFFLDLGIVAMFLMFARRIFASKFEHARVRWVRKLAHPPVYIAEISFLAFGLLIAGYTGREIDLLMLKSNFAQATFVISQYLNSIISLGLTITGCILCCSFLIKKAIVCGDHLYLKSMTYTSIRIPLAEIESITAMSFFRVLSSFRILNAVRWRFHFWNPFFWQKGTLIRLKSGKTYFVGIRKSELAANELTEHIPATQESIFGKAA